MSHMTPATGTPAPRPLLSLAAELEAQAAQALRPERSAPVRLKSQPERARPGALARALVEARTKAAAGVLPVPTDSVIPQPPVRTATAKPQRPRALELLAGLVCVGAALALFFMPISPEQRDLALGALLCLALGLAAFTAERAAPGPRRPTAKPTETLVEAST